MKYSNHFTIRLTTGEIKEQDRISASVPEFIADMMAYGILEPNQIVSIRRDSTIDGETNSMEWTEKKQIREILDATLRTLDEYQFWIKMAKKDIKTFLETN